MTTFERTRRIIESLEPSKAQWHYTTKELRLADELHKRYTWEVVTFYLQKEGYKLRTSNSLKQAVHKARKEGLI